MKEKLETLEKEFLNDLNNVADLKGAEDIKVKYFGKSGEFAQLMKMLKDAPAEQKRELGSLINTCKTHLTDKLEHKLAFFKQKALEEKLKNDKIDVTLPGDRKVGSKHVINVVLDKIISAFKDMGFSIFYTNEIVEHEYNFDKLNIALDHPARDSQDTFYVDDKFLLRSQTTVFQAKVMEKYNPPIKMITFGKVYRGDEPDATHMPIFNQLDVMVVDKGITLPDLKGFLMSFAKRMFGEQTKVRMRPSFFPFTEPSVEVDLTCVKCKGKGCAMCKYSGWLEILGGGIMSSKVLEQAGIDSKVYSGFALGLGIERIVMVLTGISDLRTLYENDVRLLKQYR